MTQAGEADRFQGLFVAMITLFDDKGRLDAEAMAAHAAWLVSEGVAGLCPLGTTGEFLFLSEAEKILAIRATVEGAGGSAPVIAGAWALTQGERIRICRSAEEAGAAAAFFTTPIYYPADNGTIEAWYGGVRRECGLPLFAYNIPQYAGNEISIELVRRLFDEGICAGIKDSTGREDRLKELLAAGGRARIFAASDAFALRSRQIGAHGFISGLANAAPRLLQAAWDGDAGAQQRVDTLRDTIKRAGGIAGIKRLTSRRGFATCTSRLPDCPLGAEQIAALDSVPLD